MVSVSIDLGRIVDEAGFHDAFADALRLPAAYGRNMNAWIDCLSDWSRPGVAGMIGVEVPLGDDLVLDLEDAAGFLARAPGLAVALWDATAAVNARRRDMPNAGRLLLHPR